MALSVPLLSEDQLLCPICLGVFVKPVSTPCGHNFCMSCLSSYWDSSAPVCLCPVCKESFSVRPQLRVNTVISELSQSFSSLQLRQETQTSVLSLIKAHMKLRDQLDPNNAKLASLIQERVQRVCSIRETKAQRQEETRQVITQSEEVLQDVLKKVQKSHKDLVQKMEEKQQQADSEAEALVEQTEKEIADLIETQTKLQELQQTEDPLIFLQKHPNISLVGLNSVSTLSLKVDEKLQEMRETLKSYTGHLQMLLQKLDSDISLFNNEKWCDLRRVQRHAVDIKLDPDTAQPDLLLSPDLKQVWFIKGVTQAPENNSRRFLVTLAVIADTGFSHGCFYFEVSVGQKEEWILGLLEESVPRNKVIPEQPDCGLWALYFRVDKFYTYFNPDVPVYMGKAERVGVFVDCDKGLLSFYDVKTATCIYKFNNNIIEEKLYPFLNPCDDEFPSNLGSMMIVDPK